MEKRKLASVQYIHHITPIEGADKIECVHVLGWQCVANKGQFQAGDRCVYIEVDSFLPVCEKFEFLRSSSFKKSEILGIRKWEMEERVTSSGTVIGDFPHGITKTDELRVQSYPDLISEFKAVPAYYISTKMDGTSVTMYWKEGRFGVCGRNYEYEDNDKCAMWKYVHEHKIEERLKENNIPDVAIQGEFCGAGIQKNRLKLVKPEWYVFTIVNMETGCRYPLRQMQELKE